MKPPLQWISLAALSAAVTAGAVAIGLPAALLVGPMIAAIAVGANGGTITLPAPVFAAAQTIIACMVAASFSPGIFASFAENWLPIAAAVIATVGASGLLGWLISRWRILPGTTGIWGSAPGAATAMVLMAGAFGADQRLVAFMQYLRVIMVALGTALIARLWFGGTAERPGEAGWFADTDFSALALTVAVAAAGGIAGRLLRLPTPWFLGPLVLATALGLTGTVTLHLPQWLLFACYVAIGWRIGLMFRRDTLRHAARSLPQVVLSILVLMALCGGIAWLLSHELGIDPLTAFLATSPGGMDVVAVIAAATDGVDTAFVMTLQAIRFLFVLVLGPPLARLVARRVPKGDPP